MCVPTSYISPLHAELAISERLQRRLFRHTFRPGLFREIPPREKAAKVVLDFLQNLRREKRLFTREEFATFDPSKWVEKWVGGIGRITGKSFIESRVSLLGLKHIKVPQKVLVTNNTFGKDPSKVVVTLSSSGQVETEFDLVVWAEKIVGVERKLSLKEALEILKLLEFTGYNDFSSRNVVIAANGIYFIDTEFPAFDKEPYFKNELYEQLKGMMAEKDHKALKEEIEKRAISNHETLPRDVHVPKTLHTFEFSKAEILKGQ